MTGDNRPEPRVVCFGVILAAAAVFYAVFVARTGFYIGDELFFTLFDDAMISMRYAKNLAGGYGLVWNPGLPPVEGYTNFLWTLWMALVHLLPIAASKYSLVIMLTGVALLLANVIVARSLVLELVPRRGAFAELYVSLSVAFLYPLIFWTLRGLEVGLLALLVDAALLMYLRLSRQFTRRRAVAFAALLALLCLVRDDAIVSAAVLSLSGIGVGWRSRRPLFIVVALAALLVPEALHLAGRFAYYGEFVPNTYYLKMTGISDAERLGRGVTVALGTALRQLLLPIGIVALGAAGLRRTAAWKTQLLPFVAIFAGNLAYSIYVGGDAWEWMNYANRFIAVGLTPLIVVVGVAAEDILASAPAIPLGGLSPILIVCGISLAAQGGWDLCEKWHFGVLREAATGSVASLVTTVAGLTLGAVSGAAHLLGARQKQVVASGKGDVQVRSSGTYWLMALLMVVTTDGRPLAQWTLRSAEQLEADQAAARLGVFLGATTRSEAAVAVILAGAVPYFTSPTGPVLIFLVRVMRTLRAFREEARSCLGTTSAI